MKKLVVYLTICVFLLASFTAINVKPVNAAKVAMEWGHLNYNLANYNQTRFNNELFWESTICGSVNTMLWGNGWLCSNSYGASTTPTNVYNVLDNVANPSNGVTSATTFWVGDYCPSMSATPAPYGYLGCYTSVNGSYVWDYDVYNHATANGIRSSKNYVTFMWTCANGGTYWSNSQGGYNVVSGIIFPIIQSYMPTGTPPVNTNTYYGYRVDPTHTVGMPYAWTGTTGMSLDGYNNPSGAYAYMGWECNSPFMIDTPPAGKSSTGLQYLHFIHEFYSYALGYVTGYLETINDSLNYAARIVFGLDPGNNYYNFGTSVLNTGQWLNEPNFPQTINNWFYCRLRVFGNGNLKIN